MQLDRLPAEFTPGSDRQPACAPITTANGRRITPWRPRAAQSWPSGGGQGVRTDFMQLAENRLGETWELLGRNRMRRWVVQAEHGLAAWLSIDARRWQGIHRLAFALHPSVRGQLERSLVDYALSFLADYPAGPCELSTKANTATWLRPWRPQDFPRCATIWRCVTSSTPPRPRRRRAAADAHSLRRLRRQAERRVTRRSRTMTTAEERLRILKMVEQGQISAEDGSRLLEALSAGEQRRAPTTPPGVGAEAAGRWLHVRVTDTRTGRNKVNVTIPMGLVDVGLKMGARFAPGDGSDSIWLSWPRWSSQGLPASWSRSRILKTGNWSRLHRIARLACPGISTERQLQASAGP